MPPGPDLACLLGVLTPALIPNDDIDDVLVAQSRQLAHEQARMLALLAEVVCRRPFAGPGEVRRGVDPVPYAADEVRAALVWTRRAAETETDFAWALVHRLPLVFAALDAGDVDRARAWVFVHHVGDLTDAQIHTVCTALLPIAGRLTTGQLGERLRRMVLELDPEYYERRYRRSVRERRVICYLDADGTATITASGLPAEEAAAAIERLDSLSRAARRHGHPGTLDQIRADLILGLMDGSLHTLTRDRIIDALVARYAGGTCDPTDDVTSDIATVHRGRGAANSGVAHANAERAGSSGGAAAGSGTASSATGTRTAGTNVVSRTGDGETSVDHVEPGGRGDVGSADPADHTVGIPARTGPVTHRPPEDQRVGVEIRVPLPTLLGHDERAGELPGLGPVTADTARRTVARQRRATWRWVVVDTDGHLISEGITRRRPHGMARNGPRGGVVELQIRETDLDRLAADPDACGDWAGVVTDIATRHRDRAAHVPDLDADPGRRFPTAAQRRHVEIRDRACTFPGCRAPARRSDADHTVDHHHGGPTVVDDLSPLCRHDHMLKHEGGWQLRQPEPGRFVWRSPLGREHPVAPEPILPPPIDHTPRDPEPYFDEPADDTDHPLEPPKPGRAPPHDPHDGPRLASDQDDGQPRRGRRGQPRRGRSRVARTDPADDPPPF
ncbi:uncharacterized protein DUF222 [Pseudonocardia sediminis]|uniref:Uncharacterized protein DUF222 n=2 Tax=Pseudonocardia sediminis TaxID=1397368 RepID=A0A4Q7UY50_PSEST|nr:uncharacterized protein DUF222 [Pseudonocardia sediminis]